MKKHIFVKNYLPPVESAVAEQVLDDGDRPLKEWRKLWQAELTKPVN